MHTDISPEIREVLEVTHSRPAVSVILPFEPKINPKSELSQILSEVVDKVSTELMTNYPDDIAMLVIHKLKKIISNLNYSTYKKSIAIYVSPVFEKVLYLDIPVIQKITVDESFEIHDLVYAKKETRSCMLLVLGSDTARIYYCNENSFSCILSNKAKNTEAHERAIIEKTGEAADEKGYVQLLENRFLRHTDNAMQVIISAYRVPFFVLAPQKIVEKFKNITANASSIIDYVPGNYESATIDDLKILLNPHIANWKIIKGKILLNRMDAARSEKRLVAGVKDVWQEAKNHNGYLLMLEKDYMDKAQYASVDNMIYKATKPFWKFSYIRDAVDEIIENVLENDGDVEFVEKGLLQDDNGISLILRHSKT